MATVSASSRKATRGEDDHDCSRWCPAPANGSRSTRRAGQRDRARVRRPERHRRCERQRRCERAADNSAARGPPQTATLKFVAGGNQKNGQGQFTFTEPGIGYSVTANVACYYQEKVGPKARRAVFSGPVIAQNPNQGTNGFVVAVADNNDSPYGPSPDSPPGPKDFFETAPFDPTSHNCAQDFPPDRFDNDRVLADAWYVTSGNIVIG